MEGYRRHHIEREGAALVAYVQPGQGPVVVFQHGLGGDAAQPAEVFPNEAGARHAVLDCRGHGESAMGDPTRLSIATFAADVIALIEAIGTGPCIVGGISMGAAIASRIAVDRPDLVRGLVLGRPAWVTQAAPVNMQPVLEVGEILAQPAHDRDLPDYLASPTARRLAVEAADNLASLRGFFAREPRTVIAELLTRIARDGPGIDEAALARLTCPTLVIANPDDVIHPIDHATRLAALIPHARFVEIPSKARDRAGHVAAFRRTLADFIKDVHHG